MTDLNKTLDDLIAKRDKIKAQTAPLHKERNAILDKIRPDEDKARDLALKIRKIEQPELGDTEKQITVLEAALNKKPGNKTLPATHAVPKKDTP